MNQLITNIGREESELYKLLQTLRPNRQLLPVSPLRQAYGSKRDGPYSTAVRIPHGTMPSASLPLPRRSSTGVQTIGYALR